jgi:trehalose 6-phosphate phosphatase
MKIGECGEDTRMPPATGISRRDVVDSLKASLPSLLVATDFDGTLAPLTLDPEESRPADGALAALRALGAAGARIAVITGRAAATVVRVGGLEDVPELRVAGLYGAESWHDGRLETLDVPPALDQLRERLPEILRANGADPAVWIEDKKLSLVVHARRAADPDAALEAIRGPVENLAGELGLEAHPGSQVIEIRLPGFDKARALRQLVDEADDSTAVLFCGDDLGDVPAFEEIRRLRAAGRVAWGVGVISSNAPLDGAADLEVADPEAVVALLRELAS